MNKTRARVKPSRLKFVSDDEPGIARVGRGKRFRYVNSRGKTIRAAGTLNRIKKLVIPPAWQDVWISPNSRGHIQAVGRDDRGRKQYLYHPRWVEARDDSKYARMLEFGQALPKIRSVVKRDIKQPGLPQEKIIAAIVTLLEDGSIRIGNEEYEKTNKTYGLTTLKSNHAKVRGESIRFRFRGKGGLDHEVDITDRRVARIIKKCQDLPGQRLFEYLDDNGKARKVNSTDVNNYVREAAGDDFTAKDFRTWAATLQAAIAFCECKPCDTETEQKKQINEVIKCVAKALGNTPAICRKSYIHPGIIEAFQKGTILGKGDRRMRNQMTGQERALLRLLRQLS